MTCTTSSEHCHGTVLLPVHSQVIPLKNSCASAFPFVLGQLVKFTSSSPLAKASETDYFMSRYTRYPKYMISVTHKDLLFST